MDKKIEDDDVRKKLFLLWLDDIKLCSNYFGTDEYIHVFERFENDIVDVPGIAPFKQIMNTKKKELFNKGNKWYDQYCKDYPFESKTIENQDDKKREIKQILFQELYNYMLGIIMEKMF